MEFFKLFSSLPTELRLHIWRGSFQPRAVEVRYLPEIDECRSITKPPVVLHVCQESREEALRFYHKAFGTRTHEAAIYFNSIIDILYVPRHRPMGYDETVRDFPSYVLDTANQIQTLAIDHVLPDIKRPWETYNKLCLMMNLPNLREAFMIISAESDDGITDTGAEIEIIDPKEDQTAILRLMEEIEQTFSHEIEEICWDEPVTDLQGDTSNSHHIHHPSYPRIVPKSKISHVWGSHGTMIRCI